MRLCILTNMLVPVPASQLTPKEIKDKRGFRNYSIFDFLLAWTAAVAKAGFPPRAQAADTARPARDGDIF
jgi:hypothetical protein